MHKEWEIRIGKVGHLEYEDIYDECQRWGQRKIIIRLKWKWRKHKFILRGLFLPFQSWPFDMYFNMKMVQRHTKHTRTASFHFSILDWQTDLKISMLLAPGYERRPSNVFFFWIYYFYRCWNIPHHQVFIRWPLCGRLFLRSFNSLLNYVDFTILISLNESNFQNCPMDRKVCVYLRSWSRFRTKVPAITTKKRKFLTFNLMFMPTTWL